MFNRKWRSKLSTLVVSIMLASLAMPINVSFADNAQQTSGDQVPLLSTVPAAGATVVRPDTKIQIKLDPQNSHYDEWSKKYADQNLALALITDGGEGVFTKTNSDLTFDAATGTLTFTPPATLTRYTTYGVVVGQELPGWLQPQNKTLHVGQLPDAPQLQTQAVDLSSLLSSSAAPASGQVDTSVLQLSAGGTAKESHNSQSLDSANLLGGDQASATTQPALATKAAETRYIGPQPVHVIHSDWQPINVKDGDDQKGVIEAIHDAQITLFGGQQFVVDSSTHIHVPGQTQSTITDLHPGDFVEVTLNDQSQVQNVNDITQHDLVSYVFTTGSALHEPTHVTVEQQERRPRVTDDGHFTLVSSDDYGLPAWGSQVQLNLLTADKTPLDASAAVLPSTAFTTTDPSGNTPVTVVDHVPQHLAVEISLNGPNMDGHDAHGLLALFDFRPGLPAKATLEAPDKLEVGTLGTIEGTVTDVYGNLVEDGSELDLAASAGTIQTPVYTDQGHYVSSYTAATKVQDVSLSLRSAEGNAMAFGTIHLFPGDPATMTMDAPDKLQAGDTTTISGDVYDRYGNTVLDGSQLLFTASSGTLPATTGTLSGHYQIDYAAPTKVQVVNIAAVSQKGTASANRNIQIIPGPPAILSLQAQNTSLYTEDSTALSGLVADKYNNLIDGQTITLQAEHGALSDQNPVSNASGWYASTYTAPFYNGVDTVSATAGAAQASVNLNISSAGTGINPVTGQVEKVAAIYFDQKSYNLSPNQIGTLTGHVYDSNGQPLEQVIFSSKSATAGTITGLSLQTDATGKFTLTYQAPASQAAATVTVTTNQVSGTATVNTLAYGYGYNPVTKKWEPVGSLWINTSNYKTISSNALTNDAVTAENTSQYTVSLLPNTTVQMTGYAYNTSGQPLSSVQFDTVTATGGTLTTTPSDSTGAFTLNYQTPSTVGNQALQVGSGSTFALLSAYIMNPGQGINAVTGAVEDIKQIVFSPSTYNVVQNQSTTISGTVYGTSGQPLRLAKVNIAVTGGTANSQVITGSNGTFSLTYAAPAATGTYTMTGSATNATYGTVKGTATINVTIPPSPTFSGPYLHIWGYSDPYIYYSVTVLTGSGQPMTDAYAAANNYQLYLETGKGLNQIPLRLGNGYVSGSSPAIYWSHWVAGDPYGGWTDYYWYMYDLRLYQSDWYSEHTICWYYYTQTISYYHYGWW